MSTSQPNKRSTPSSVPYTHCKTKIINLRSLSFPSNLGADADVEQTLKEVLESQADRSSLEDLHLAVQTLKTGLAPPIAFPTETVYGLAADATRSDSVQSIFAAKNRPLDNPLIVHVAHLSQLESLMGAPLPDQYQPLVQKFWPGPLTILLRLPDKSPFAPEVTAGRSTVGIRMPSTPLARLLISLVGKPVAAPSANASTRPSPTTAQHVLEDMSGRINFILDGGPCDVGVESTVVDGLCDPPEILRPGGVGISQIRALGGTWSKTIFNHHDGGRQSSENQPAPRAPGMKYRHYSPKARVILFESGGATMDTASQRLEELAAANPHQPLGIIATATWTLFAGLMVSPVAVTPDENGYDATSKNSDFPLHRFLTTGHLGSNTIYNIHLPTTTSLAKYLFAALRTLDQLGVVAILVEGVAGSNSSSAAVGTIYQNQQDHHHLPEGVIRDEDGEYLADAVMNRLRKAAEVE